MNKVYGVPRTGLERYAVVYPDEEDGNGSRRATTEWCPARNGRCWLDVANLLCGENEFILPLRVV